MLVSKSIEAAKIGVRFITVLMFIIFKRLMSFLINIKFGNNQNENELSNKVISDLNKSNLMIDEKIKIINNLGKEILDNTYNEIIKFIK